MSYHFLFLFQEIYTLPVEHQKLIVLSKISCKGFAELITYFAKTHDPAVLHGETIANTLKCFKPADIEDMKKKLNNSGHIFDTQASGTVIKIITVPDTFVSKICTEFFSIFSKFLYLQD